MSLSLDGASANGNGKSLAFNGGLAVLDAGGTWATGVVKFEIKHDDGIGWKVIRDENDAEISFSNGADYPVVVNLGNCDVRAVLSSATGGEVIYAGIWADRED